MLFVIPIHLSTISQNWSLWSKVPREDWTSIVKESRWNGVFMVKLRVEHCFHCGRNVHQIREVSEVRSWTPKTYFPLQKSVETAGVTVTLLPQLSENELLRCKRHFLWKIIKSSPFKCLRWMRSPKVRALNMTTRYDYSSISDQGYLTGPPNMQVESWLQLWPLKSSWFSIMENSEKCLRKRSRWLHLM